MTDPETATEEEGGLKDIFEITDEVDEEVQALQRAMEVSTEAISRVMEGNERRVWELGIRLNIVEKRQDKIIRREVSAFLNIPDPAELTEELYQPDQWYWDPDNNQPVYVLREFLSTLKPGEKSIKYAEVRYFDPINRTYLGAPAGTVYIPFENLVPIQVSCDFQL